MNVKVSQPNLATGVDLFRQVNPSCCIAIRQLLSSEGGHKYVLSAESFLSE